MTSTSKNNQPEKADLLRRSRDDAWQEMFARLRAFKAQHGHLSVSVMKIMGGQPNPHRQLGVWFSNQRVAERSGTLMAQRKEALVRLGVSFEPQKDLWQEMLARLEAFKAQHGHCDVSTMKIVAGQPNPDCQLGKWCSTQRTAEKGGVLMAHRKEALLKMGFSFLQKDVSAMLWPAGKGGPLPAVPTPASARDELVAHVAANRGRQMDAFDDPELGRMRG